MNDWGIVGHDWAVRRLKSAIGRGQLAQSHLFVGPPSVGKSTLALATARALLSHDDRTRALVDQLKHPDLAWIEPDGDSIKVEVVRDLLHSLTLAPVESRHRVAVVNQAHLATDSGKNAILKTLEEPNPSVVIILIAPTTDVLLPTIVSRCQILNLRPAPVRDVIELLRARGAPQERAGFIGKLSRGRVGWALRAIEDETLLEARIQRLNDLQLLLASNRTQRFAYAERLSKRDSTTLQEVLNEWLLFWRDVARMTGTSSHTASLLNSDYADSISQVAENVSEENVASILRAISDTMLNLDRNVNARLALDVLLLKLPFE